MSTFYHLDDHHMRNGIVHLNVLPCCRTKCIFFEKNNKKSINFINLKKNQHLAFKNISTPEQFFENSPDTA